MLCFRRKSKKGKLIEELESHLMMLEGQHQRLKGQHQRLEEDVKREKQKWSKLEKTHQEESRQKQQQVIELQTERSALETALLQASERATSAQRQLDDTVQEKTDLQEALSDTTGKLQKAHEEIQALKDANAEDTIRYMSIVTKHQDEKKAMFDRNQEAMDLLNAQIQDAKSYIDKLKTQMEEQETKLGTEASQLKATLAKTQKELDEYSANVLMKNSVIAEMEAAKKTSDDTIQDLRKQLELKNKMISTLTEDKEKEKQQLSKTKKELEQRSAKVQMKNSVFAAMEAENTKVKAENRELKTNIPNQESQLRDVHAASEKRLLAAQNKYMDDVQALTVVCEEALKKVKRTSEHTIQELKKQLEQKDKAIHNLTENNEKEKQQLAKIQKELEEYCTNLLMKNSVIAATEEENAKVKAENRDLKTRILDQESQLKNVHAATEKRLLVERNKYMNEVKAQEVEEAVNEAKKTSDQTLQELKKQLGLKDKVIHDLTEKNKMENKQLAKTQKELEEYSANLLMKNSGMEEYIAKLKAEIRMNTLQSDVWVEEVYDEADDTVEEWEEERIEMERVQQCHLEEIQRLRESLESSEKERKELESVAREMLETKYGELTALSEGKKKQEVGMKKQVENQSRPVSDLDESAKKHIQDLRDLFSYQIQEAKTDAAVKIRQLEAKILEQQLKNGHASEQDKNVSRCY